MSRLWLCLLLSSLAAGEAPLISGDAGPSPVVVSAAELQVEVRGPVALSSLELTLRNDGDRPLEANLALPLPNGAVVSGYALEVDGQLVDGVVVDKQQARIAFDAEVRKGVDPGLVEQVRGNRYALRIYPVPAHGTRRLAVRFVQELEALAGGDRSYRLPVPAELKRAGGRFEILLEQRPDELAGGRRAALPPAIAGSLAELPADADLAVDLGALPELVVCDERNDLDQVVLISHAPRLPPPPPPRPAPARVGIVWDASASRTPEASERELAALVQLFTVWRDAEAVVVVLRDRAEAPRSVPIRGGDSRALVALLRAEPADGGTDLGALDLGAEVGCWLLCSDGLNSLGEQLPQAPRVPVYPLTAAMEADQGVLARLARRSGGALLDLRRLSAAEAVQRIVAPGWQLLRVEAPTGSFCDLVPGGAVAVDGRVTVSARLGRGRDEGEGDASDPVPAAGQGIDASGAITVTLVYGLGDTVVLRTPVPVRVLPVTDASMGPARAVGVAWARARLAELAADPRRNRQRMASISHGYGVVTADTSLLVLETLEQHLAHHIVPPASRPVLLDGYWKGLAAEKQRMEADAGQRLEALAAAWKEHVAWWSTAVRVDPGFRYRAPVGAQGGPQPALANGRAGGERALANAAVGSPPPAATAAPMAAGLMARDADALAAKSGGDDGEPSATIAIAPWDPATPWLAALKRAPPAEAYAAYLAQRAAHGGGPGLILDCADFLLRAGQRELGLRVLSNLAELRLDDPALLRVYAWRLRQAGDDRRAIVVLRRVLAMRPDEPQSHRDLALALGDLGMATHDGSRVNEALAELRIVALGSWERFPGIGLIALEEMNHLFGWIGTQAWTATPEWVDLDPRLRADLPMGVRIVLEWDADLTDVDLHVVEPSGEEAFYGHQRTTIGGLVSQDFTNGYGPERYGLRTAMPGIYAITAHYYGSHQQTVLGPATVQATVFTGYGTPAERRQVLTLRLDRPAESVAVGTIAVAAAP